MTDRAILFCLAWCASCSAAPTDARAPAASVAARAVEIAPVASTAQGAGAESRADPEPPFVHSARRVDPSERAARVRSFAELFVHTLLRHDYARALGFFAADNYATQRGLGIEREQYIAESIGLFVEDHHRGGPVLTGSAEDALRALHTATVERVERLDDHFHVSGRLVSGTSEYELDLSVFEGDNGKLEIRGAVG